MVVNESVSSRRRMPVYLVDSAGVPVTGLVPVSGEIKISKNGAAEANHLGSWGEVGNGLYYYQLAESEVDTLGFVTVRVNIAGAEQFVGHEPIVYDTRRPTSTPTQHVHGLQRGVSAKYLYVTLHDVESGAIKLSPTIAAGDFQISKDGGALANLTNLPVESPAGSGLIKIELTSAESNAANVIIKWKDQSGDEWLDGSLEILTRVVTTDDLVRAETPDNSLKVSASGHAAIDLNEVNSPVEAKDWNVRIAECVDVTNVSTVAELGEESITDASFADEAITGAALESTAIQKIWDHLTAAMTTADSVGKLVVDTLTSVVNQLLGFGADGANTLKGYLQAMSTKVASNPTELSGFDAATHSLEAIGDASAKIGAFSDPNETLADVLDENRNSLAAVNADGIVARLDLTIDATNSRDEYTMVLYNNGRLYTPQSWYVGPRLTLRSYASGDVLETADGSKIPNTSAWKFIITGSGRLSPGEPIIASITGFTTELKTVECFEIIGRDGA